MTDDGNSVQYIPQCDSNLFNPRSERRETNQRGSRNLCRETNVMGGNIDVKREAPALLPGACVLPILRIPCVVLPLCLAVAGLLLCAVAVGETDFEPKLRAPSEEAIRQAGEYHIFRYGRDARGGAHTNGAWSGASLPVLAIAAYAGEEQVDERLLRQVRNILRGGNSPSANGGYPAQHEVLFTSAAVVMKNTPRIWDQLSEEERLKVDLILKACMVASAHTTSDRAYEDGKRPHAIDGCDNFHRGWNPNFREGMVGNLLIGAVYFGPDKAQDMLSNYDHEEFVAELRDAGLDNTYGTFNWKADHPDSDAPAGEEIERNVRDFTYLDKDLTDPMALYEGLTLHTYGAVVSPGLNDGEGIDGGGRIAAGAEELPNRGETGMLREFDARDAGGPRSSVGYAYHGFRPNLFNQVALIVTGYWEEGPAAEECIRRIEIGAADLFYKLEHGYINYAHGRAAGGPTDITDHRHDYRITRDLWENVLMEYHQRSR